MDDMNDEHESKHSHKKHESKNYMEHAQHKKHKNYQTIAWAMTIVTVVLGIFLIASILTKGFSGGGLSEDEIRQKTQAYLTDLLGASGQTATIESISDTGDLYQVKLNVGGQTFDSYVTKDGKLLFPQAMDMTQAVQTGGSQTAQPSQPENIPKADKPTVELFVMSHCPFGTQAEKGMLPVVRTLGDKIDFKVRFVYYAMHGKKEVDEQLNQYCIQKEQPDEYLKYLACFLNASDGPGCLKSTGVDEAKMKTCVAAADKEFGITKSFEDQSSWLSGQFPLFNTDKELNTKYEVGGSPTLVINGVQSNAGRSPASYLSAICNAMNEKAPECDTTLETANPGPGFGYDSTAAATAAGCGV